MKRIFLLIVVVLAGALVPQSVMGTAQASGSSTTPVWIGAPFAGMYGGSGGRGGYPPHSPYSGNWAMDLFKYGAKSAVDVTSTGVYLYVRPKDQSKSISATVIYAADSSCGAGKTIRVQIKNGTSVVGWVSFTHVTSSLKVNNTVTPYGGKIGTIWYKAGARACWNVNYLSSAHVHIEARNQVGQSCYRGLAPGSKVGVHEYIGYIGRNDSGACAAGA